MVPAEGREVVGERGADSAAGCVVVECVAEFVLLMWMLLDA